MTSRSSARTTTGWTSSTRRCWGDRRTATTRSPPYAAIDFTTLGDASDDGQVAAAAAMASKAGATDVLVLTHGWNNDKKRAQAMFDRLSGHLPGFRSYSAGRTLAIVGVLWPSVRWADEDNIAGGGASVLGPGTALDAAISESVDDPQIAQELRQAAHHLDTSAARADFTAALGSILPVGSYRGEDPIPEALVAWDADELFAAVADAAWLDEDDDDWPTSAAGESEPIRAADWSFRTRRRTPS